MIAMTFFCKYIILIEFRQFHRHAFTSESHKIMRTLHVE